MFNSIFELTISTSSRRRAGANDNATLLRHKIWLLTRIYHKKQKCLWQGASRVVRFPPEAGSVLSSLCSSELRRSAPKCVTERVPRSQHSQRRLWTWSILAKHFTNTVYFEKIHKLLIITIMFIFANMLVRNAGWKFQVSWLSCTNIFFALPGLKESYS